MNEPKVGFIAIIARTQVLVLLVCKSITRTFISILVHSSGRYLYSNQRKIIGEEHYEIRTRYICWLMSSDLTKLIVN